MKSNQAAVLLLALSGASSALPSQKAGKRDSTCTTLTQRKVWTDLTADEQSDYLAAELCLMNTAPKSGIPNAKNRWDEIQWVHVKNTPFVHEVGQFLPWHRGYVTLHERLLHEDCGYTGPTPYWNETADVGNLAGSALLTSSLIGTNGQGDDSCVTDGVFGNMTLHLDADGEATDYCLKRQFNDEQFQMASQGEIDACMATANYSTAWPCFSQAPQNAGHGGIAGTMVDFALSPGDPMFFMHHTWLDYLWWTWQSVDLDARLTDMDGDNYPPDSFIQVLGVPYPGPDVTDYDGDSGNVTTLQHVLWYVDVMANLTVADVMDVRGDTVCAEYV